MARKRRVLSSQFKAEVTMAAAMALLKPGLPPEATTAYRLTEEGLKDMKDVEGASGG